MTTRCPPKAEATGSNPVGCTSFPRENVHRASPHPCRTLQEHARTDRDSAYNDRTAVQDGFWLSQRRDGASDRWMVTWYDPAMRCQRYRSTRTTDRAVAEAYLARFAERTEIVPGARYDAPRPSLLVYFVGGDVGGVKIGTTRDIRKRLVDLQCGSPIPLRLLASCAGGNSVELAYHRRFAAHRLHGEWFERHDELEAEIARLKAEAEV